MLWCGLRHATEGYIHMQHYFHNVECVNCHLFHECGTACDTACVRSC